MEITPSIFLGPPGTGKTTTLLNVVEMEMSNGVPPDRIGFFTFTKRGVQEGISRASTRFKLPEKSFRYFNTLHAAAYRQLGLKQNEVFNNKKMGEFGQTYGYEVRGGLSSDDGTYGSFFGDDLILFLENLARITRTPIQRILETHGHTIADIDHAAKCMRDFRKFKEDNGLLDFTDMIEEFIRLDDPPRLEVLIVDEAQDLSELQWEMVFLLSRYVKRMYIAGDDDQTIFTWAGASERFISMPGNVKVLDQSFRVPITVHKLANKIISDVRNRREKEWNPRDAEGSVRYIENISDLDYRSLAETDTMMLARTVKRLNQSFRPFCRLHGLPFRYFEHNSIPLTLAEAITGWIDLHDGYRVPATQATRIYDLLSSEGHGKVPGVKRGGKASLNRYAEQPEITVTIEELRNEFGMIAQGKWQEVFTKVDAKDVEYINKVMKNGFKITDQPKIHISTIHRVKGGQADTVVVMSDTTKKSEEYFTDNQDEETRVFYTAVTRTYEDLIIVLPARRHYFGGML